MFVGNVIVAHLIASELSLARIVVMLSRILVALTVVGLAAYFLRFGQMYYFDVHQRPNILGSQPFRGFTAHKILTGLYATIGALTVLATMRGWARLVCMAAFGLAVALTGSMIGIVLFSACIPLYFIVYRSLVKRVRPTGLLLAAGSVVALTVPITVANWDRLLQLLSRDSTLTGRTTLWDLGINVWERRPILGWGFSAYLESSYSTITNRLFNRYGEWDIPHFHQSYIQTAVDLGLVGLVALLAILVSILVMSYRYAISFSPSVGAFTFVSTLIMSIAGAVMFIFFNYNHFGTFLLMLMFFALRRSLSGPRVEARININFDRAAPTAADSKPSR